MAPAGLKEVRGFRTGARIPPQDADAERALLGSLMLRPQGMHQIVDLISPESFYMDRHADIYRAMQDLFGRGEPIDLVSVTSLLRERAANTAVQKYTLLFAGGLLVPLILGTVSSLAAGFDFGQMDGIGLGVDAAQKMALNEAVQVANIAYIAEYALIASAFIAFQEGKSGKAFLYALFLVPAGMLAYFAGKGF